MAIIRFGPWLPDMADLGNSGVVRAANVFVNRAGYGPVGALTPISNALDARPRGALSARDKDGNAVFYAGDAAKLYRLSGGSWTDASKAGGYGTADEEAWEFVPWKNKVLATNFTDHPQQLTHGSPPFADLTTALKMRHIAVLRDFVVAANTFDATDGLVPDRVRTSAFNDETDWTVSSKTGATTRDLKKGGWVQRVIGGEFAIIVSERATFRMNFAGAPTWFQVDEILPEVGALAPGAVTAIGDTVYFWSNQGFVALRAGSEVGFIGAGRVDRTARADLDETYLHRMSAAIDPRSQRVAWAYPGAGNVDGRPNKILIYDRAFDRWTVIEDEVELIWRAAGAAMTLEDFDALYADLEAVPGSFDDRRWKGASAQLAAFDETFAHGFFDGANMTGQIDSREVEIHTGRRTELTGFVPLVDGGTVSAQVGTRERQADAVSFGSSLSLRASGRFATRATARYHRFRLDLSGAWTDALGVQVEPHDARPAARRAA